MLTLLLLLVLAAASLLIRAVWAVTRKPLPGVEALTLSTDDGWLLQLHHRRPAQLRYTEPVLLIHGLANNHRTMEFLADQSLGASLASAGFDVYSIDVRGCRGSVAPDPEWPADFSVDDSVRHDLPAAVAEIKRRSGAGKVWVVGFSLGGLMALAMVEEGQPVAGVCTIGAPAYFSLPRWVGVLLRIGVALTFAGPLRLDWGAALLAPLARLVPLSNRTPFANFKGLSGRIQALLLAVTIEPISKGVMAQMYNWVTTGRMTSLDGRDWREGLRQLRVPAFIVGGSVDGLATEDSTRQLAALMPHAQVAVLSKSGGQSRDYGHGDLLGASSSPAEVHRPIVEWLSARASQGPFASVEGAQEDGPLATPQPGCEV